MKWITRFPRTAIGIAGVLLILAGGTAVGFLSFRTIRRVDTVHDRIAQLERLRDLRAQLEISLLDEIRGEVPTGSFLAEEVRLRVESVLTLAARLNPVTAEGLQRIEALLSKPGTVDRETLIDALELAGAGLELEARSQEDLLRQVREDGRRELYAGIGGLLALAALVGLTVWFLPKRLLDPLAELRTRFEGLGAGRFQAVSVEGLDAALVPLFENYNALVRRLSELEAERTARAKTLESEVRAGARALLEQHQILCDAERLAAVGETAAGLAHELRNPLAGMLAALENLRKEVNDPDQARRLELLGEEAKRVVRLLKDYLDGSRHAPEVAVATDLEGLIRSLLALLHYQAPPTVRIDHEIEEELVCVVPPGRIRQALLNLVVNSLQALDGTPGRVTVSADRRGEMLHLEVEDDGPGFPEELLSTAGQPFRTGRTAGTGLGLATVQRTAMDLGGSLSFENLVPRGASVVLSLPCRAPNEGRTIPAGGAKRKP